MSGMPAPTLYYNDTEARLTYQGDLSNLFCNYHRHFAASWSAAQPICMSQVRLYGKSANGPTVEGKLVRSSILHLHFFAYSFKYPSNCWRWASSCPKILMASS